MLLKKVTLKVDVQIHVTVMVIEFAFIVDIVMVHQDTRSKISVNLISRVLIILLESSLLYMVIQELNMKNVCYGIICMMRTKIHLASLNVILLANVMEEEYAKMDSVLGFQDLLKI